jgi:hypothetical protein
MATSTSALPRWQFEKKILDYIMKLLTKLKTKCKDPHEQCRVDISITDFYTPPCPPLKDEEGSNLLVRKMKEKPSSKAKSYLKEYNQSPGST